MLENLQEKLKKTLFAGVGATVMSADAVKSALTDLVNKGKLSADDAKAAFDKAATRGEEDIKAIYEKATARGKEALENLTCAKRLELLEQRVAALEAQANGAPATEESPCPCPTPSANKS